MKRKKESAGKHIFMAMALILALLMVGGSSNNASGIVRNQNSQWIMEYRDGTDVVPVHEAENMIIEKVSLKQF